VSNNGPRQKADKVSVNNVVDVPTHRVMHSPKSDTLQIYGIEQKEITILQTGNPAIPKV
jgi:hypothetical protein